MKPLVVVILSFAFSFSRISAQTSVVTVKWLDSNTVSEPVGVSWGVPWAKGLVKKTQSFTLAGPGGNTVPLQSWPLAYWPDGSIKWSGFAAVPGNQPGEFRISFAGNSTGTAAVGALAVETPGAIRLNTGALQCIISKKGSTILDSLSINCRVIAGNGRLECLLQQGPAGEDGAGLAKTPYHSNVTAATLEQSGPVRSVVRVEGMMRAQNGSRSWLPFTIRMYFYAGSATVRLVHTIVFDGDDKKDFISGLGICFSVPMREQLHNRHVRFGGEGSGIWAEPVQPLVGRYTVAGTNNLFAEQVSGKPIQDREKFPERAQLVIKDLPVWNDYKLVQMNADGFTIQKRTNKASTWLDVTGGKRARGFVFAGDSKGGLGIGLKDFWQSHPAALEVRNAARDTAELRVWLWSPYSEAMDMRHYDTVAHGLEATYEDVQPGFSTPHGIARTSELTLFLSGNIPSNEVLSQQAGMSAAPPLLVTTPAYLRSVNVFGAWTLPDRSTPGKQWIENELDKAVNFYRKEVDQRSWYGFWNYGDVMHAYDSVRHTWRYDIGGFAWDNTELSTDMWLWYTFLRTGRPEVFRMAEAMTRHTSEVDVYHLGKFAGLGSRHNVRHWGDGSKEVRESQAAYRRFYYYLTTDERTGDMMREVAETADVTMANYDPLRLILPKTAYPTHARIGPDWLALVGNWMTAWERTGDKRWRDKIMAGVNSFAKMPYGFASGQQGAFGYDPATKKMYQLNDTIGFIHLSVLMGGPEIAHELTDLLQDATWSRLWLQFASLYGAPKEEIIKAFGKTGSLGAPGPWYARLPAYTARVTNDDKYAQRAWSSFLSPSTAGQFDSRVIDGPNALKRLEEVPGISTNNTAQWCLNAMQLLYFAGDKMPADNPLWAPGTSASSTTRQQP